MVVELNNVKCNATKEILDRLKELVLEKVDNIDTALKFDAYFYIKDYVLRWGHKDCINPSFYSDFKTIELIDNKFQYVETKPKNNFKDYGLEADFEGDIKFVDSFGHYIGICEWSNEMPTKTQDKQTVYWIENKCYLVTLSGVLRIPNRDLKPIKKEWYENPNNFPCIATKDGKNFAVIKSIDYLKSVCIYPHIIDFRPATKEEVLALLIEE